MAKRTAAQAYPVPFYSTVILRYPSGRFGLAGSVPSALCNAQQHSLVWETEAEAEQALRDLGLPFYQKADCSWSPHRPTTDADRKLLSAFWYS
jgi:hypothetical protein